MPKTKVAEATTTAAGTTVAMIVAQAVVVAAIAVPVGLFAVALGMLAARGQTALRISPSSSRGRHGNRNDEQQRASFR